MHPGVRLALIIGEHRKLVPFAHSAQGLVGGNRQGAPPGLKGAVSGADRGVRDLALRVHRRQHNRAHAQRVRASAAVDGNRRKGVGKLAHLARIDRHLERHDDAVAASPAGLGKILVAYLQHAVLGVEAHGALIHRADFLLLKAAGVAIDRSDAGPGLYLGGARAEIAVSGKGALVHQGGVERCREVLPLRNGGGKNGGAGGVHVGCGLAVVGEARGSARHQGGVHNGNVVGRAHRLGSARRKIDVLAVVARSEHDGNALLAHRLHGKVEAARAFRAAPRVGGNANVHAGVHGALDVGIGLDRGIIADRLVGFHYAHAQKLGTVGGTAHAIAVPCRRGDARAMRAVAHHVAGIAAVAGDVAAVLVAAHLRSIGGHIEHDAAQVGVLVVDARVHNGDDASRVGVGRVVPALQVHVEAVCIAAVGGAIARGIGPLVGGSVGKLILAGNGGFFGRHALGGVVGEGVGCGVGARRASVARPIGGLGAAGGITAIAVVGNTVTSGRGLPRSIYRLGGSGRSLLGRGVVVGKGLRAVGLGPQHPLIAGERLQDLPGGHPFLLDQQRVHLDVRCLHGRKLTGLCGGGQLRALQRRIGKRLAERRLVGIARRLQELLGIGKVKEGCGLRLLARSGIGTIGLNGCDRGLGGGRHDDDGLAFNVRPFGEHGIDLACPRFLLAGFFRRSSGNRSLAAAHHAFGQRKRRAVEQHRNRQQYGDRSRSGSLHGNGQGSHPVFHQGPQKNEMDSLHHFPTKAPERQRLACREKRCRKRREARLEAQPETSCQPKTVRPLLQAANQSCPKQETQPLIHCTIPLALGNYSLSGHCPAPLNVSFRAVRPMSNTTEIEPDDT